MYALIYYLINLASYPSSFQFFNIAQEKWESLVKSIMCMTSDGTDFYVWHDYVLAKIKDWDTES